jgi:hypothetical protein
VTYPTVWLAEGARGRYYMPLYPIVAVLMGLVVEHCTARDVRRGDFLLWQLYVWGMALAAIAGGVVVAIAGLPSVGALAGARQPALFVPLWCVATAIVAVVSLWASLARGTLRSQAGIVSAAVLAALACSGAVLNTRLRTANELSPAIDQVKRQLGDPNQLVSLGRIYHRFAYSYQAPIRQVPWPMTADALPADVTYFCFDRRPGDTPEDRAGNDDRLGAHTPGVLPFAWEKIAEIPCDPTRRGQADRSVVIGRVRRPQLVAEPAASRPVRR